jgi:ubiquinone/menaquinone biosynthesis C-methylase UbiE
VGDSRGGVGMSSTSDGWQMSVTAAENYERAMVPSLFGPWAEVLVDRAGLTTGNRVLDVACGTGVVARMAAQRVGPSGSVVGADLNEGMLSVAARHVPAGLSVNWKLADAQLLPFDDDQFDVVLCQQGLQFVPDRRQAITQMRRVLRSEGVAAVAVWASIDRNPVAHARHRELLRYLGDDAMERPFRFGDINDWARLFDLAGFSTVETDTLELVLPADDPRASVEGNLGALPIAAKIEAMDDDTYEAMIDDMVASLQPWIIDGVLVAPTTTALILARS